MKRDIYSKDSLSSSSHSLYGLNNSLSQGNISSIEDPYVQHIAEIIESTILRKIQIVLDRPKTRSFATQTDTNDEQFEKRFLRQKIIF